MSREMWLFICNQAPRLCSTQLSTKFILLINVKMPTIIIVGILTFISKINTTSERLKERYFFICRYFSFYEQVEFRAQLCCAWKVLYLRVQVVLIPVGGVSGYGACHFHYGLVEFYFFLFSIMINMQTSFKQLGFRSNMTLCQAWSRSMLFPKVQVISRRH